MDAWYAWLSVFKERESDMLARLKSVKAPHERDQDLAGRSPESLRHLVGSVLIMWGTAKL